MLAPAYQLSALDHPGQRARRVIAAAGWQIRHSSVLYSFSCADGLSETLFIEQPLQRLSSAASERPQNESQNILRDDNFHSLAESEMPGQGHGEPESR